MPSNERADGMKRESNVRREIRTHIWPIVPSSVIACWRQNNEPAVDLGEMGERFSAFNDNEINVLMSWNKAERPLLWFFHAVASLRQ